MWDSNVLSHDHDPCCGCTTSRSRDLEVCEDLGDPFSNKENNQPFLRNEEMSFYDNGTPPQCTECIHSRCSHHYARNLSRGRSMDEHDAISQDSGYQGDKLASCTSLARTASYASSFDSMEDEFLDLSDVEPLDKPNLPQDFGKLIAHPIISKPKPRGNEESPNELAIRPLFRRALSLQNTSSDTTPTFNRVRTSLFRGPDEMRCFKRPDPPSSIDSSNLIKRSRMFDEDDGDEASVPLTKPVLQRAMSATEESIMCAVQRSSTEPNLIGDYSKNFSLPLTPSKHQDLKAITSDTLSRVLKGEFKDSIASYKVIDCRYPYEYDGGHIDGAINVYTKEQCIKLLDTFELPATSQKRHVLIFHCEFSSERGPNLYRYLRKEDRHRNESVYPSLCYPEIYLLEGGYKSFFEQFSEMCTPVAYKEMLHPDHEHDLKHFRQKSKVWNCNTRQRPLCCKNLKRLGM